MAIGETIHTRVTKGCGCPECYSKRRGHRKDGSRHKYPTLAECNHALLSEWDHNRNAEQGLFLEDITLGCHKPVHWVCHECSLDILHRWVTTPNTHTHHQTGCPYCKGRAVCKCNSLATMCPELAQDWDCSKNTAGPGNYAAHSGAVGWEQGDVPFFLGAGGRLQAEAVGCRALISACGIG